MRRVPAPPPTASRAAPPPPRARWAPPSNRTGWSGRAGWYDAATSMTSSYARSFTQAASLRSLTRNISKHSLQVLQALSGTSAAVHASDEQYLLDLDWRPQLSATQNVIAWAIPIIVCCLVYGFTAPASLSIPYGTCIGVLFGLLLVLVRSSFAEGMYKAKERMVTELGDPDSSFTRLENLLVHVKTKAPSRPQQRLQAAGLHCYHGFGSNTWSWSKVQQSLADSLGAVVTAHDMPGFGLTQRPTDLSAYLLSFNARLGRLVLDHELAARGLLSQRAADSAGDSSFPQAHVASTTSLDPPTAAAAAAAPAAGEEGEQVASAKEVTKRAQAEQLDTAAPAAAAAVAKGDVVGAAKAAGQVLGEAISGSSSGDSSSADPLAPSTPPPGSRCAASTRGRGSSGQQQQGPKRVLMGHSLGAVCAALEVIAEPQKYSALVLVDPAILSMGGSDKDSPLHLEELHDDSSFTRSLGSMDAAAAVAADGSSSNGSSRSSSVVDLEALAQSTDLQRADSLLTGSGSSLSGLSDADEVASAAAADATAAAGSGPLLVAGEPVAYYATKGKVGRGQGLQGQSAGNLLTALVERVTALLQAGFLMTMLMVISLLRPLILVILRAAVRSRGFWRSGLQQAYYDKSKVDDEMVNAYRLPQLVKGWENGMLQFLVARLGAVGGSGGTGAAGSTAPGPLGGLEDSKLAERLAAVANANNLPVLIVHGQGDKMVPVQNSFRLAKMMKRGRLAVLKRSGHCPQEELPAAFAEVVTKFLSRVYKP